MLIQVLNDEADEKARAKIDGERSDRETWSEALGRERSDEVTQQGSGGTTNGNQKISLQPRASSASFQECQKNSVQFQIYHVTLWDPAATQHSQHVKTVNLYIDPRVPC